jgi:hypothetical protein
MSLFVISVILVDKSYFIVGEHLVMLGQRVVLLQMIVDIHLHGKSLCTADLRTVATLAADESCVIKFVAINQNM